MQGEICFLVDSKRVYHDLNSVFLPFKKVFHFILIVGGLQIIHAGTENRLVTHSVPASLSKHAVSSDWPRFNGPYDDATVRESKLALEKDGFNFKKIWELSKGEGYSSPAITKEQIVLFHLQDGHEIIEARESESGKKIWTYKYPAEYRDRYGYSNGPRSSPVIWKNRVFAHGVTAWLTCLDLKTGNLIWKRNLKKEYQIPDYFFGKGSNPIVSGNSLILNVGGKEDHCVVAFDLNSGATKWITRDEWGASYSSPVNTQIHGKNVCLVLTGGESRPPTGGLLVIDPENGEKLSRFPWRSSTYESANAVPPVPIGNNRVFLSECYEKGGVMLSFDSTFKPKILWHKPELNIHWMTPIMVNEHLYGVAGRHQRGAEVFCVKADSGEIKWKKRIIWQTHFMNRNLNLEFFRGSLLHCKSYFIGLSELGSLILLEMNPKGVSLIDHKQLFFAPGTWTLPAISHGLLYIMQNEADRATGNGPRVICYDLRSN